MIKIPTNAKADPTAIRVMLGIERRRESFRCTEFASALLETLFVDEGAGDVDVIVVEGKDVVVIGMEDKDASAAESACETGGSMNKVEPAGGEREVCLVPVSGTGSGIEVVSATSADAFMRYFLRDLSISGFSPSPEKSLG
jgi:hypothetical protein